MLQPTFIRGSITSPIGSHSKIICQCCNNRGLMGAGVALAIAKKWKIVKDDYVKWCQEGVELGDVQFVRVQNDIVVANIIGQKGLRSQQNPKPISYEAIRKGFRQVAEYAIENKCEVHIPRLGAGLAGGKWSEIYSLVKKWFSNKDIPVFIYEI